MNKRRQRILLFVLILISAGFLALTALVILFPASSLDIGISHEIQEHHNAFIDELMYLVSCPGYMPEAPIMIGGVSLLLLLFKYKKAALFVLLTMLSGLISTIVKALVNRPRPSEDIVHIVLKTKQQSFPSGHVMFYVIFFGFLCVLMYQLQGIPKVLRILVIAFSLALMFIIPVSRIYMGAHWFTDVLGGFLMGLVCLYLLSWLYLRKRADKEEAPVAETK